MNRNLGRRTPRCLCKPLGQPLEVACDVAARTIRATAPYVGLPKVDEAAIGAAKGPEIRVVPEKGSSSSGE